MGRRFFDQDSLPNGSQTQASPESAPAVGGFINVARLLFFCHHEIYYVLIKLTLQLSSLTPSNKAI